ncbi:MAG TPA: flavin reductase family protein [Chloroflexota bacterium]|nr:flavin reductase family protein [Chloroflexota bacterium]
MEQTDPAGRQVDPDVFRTVLAHLATGVAVVTTATPEGLHGLTVNAFCSVSLTPPLVLVCIDSLSRSAELIAASGYYGVSILSAQQAFLADRFAGRAPLINRRFDDAPYFTARTGAPLLRDCLAWLDCRVVANHAAGDHRLFLGMVEAAGEGTASAALVYYNRRYYRLSVHPDTTAP